MLGDYSEGPSCKVTLVHGSRQEHSWEPLPDNPSQGAQNKKPFHLSENRREKLISCPPGSCLPPQLAGSSVLFTACKHERVKMNLAQTLLRAQLTASLPSCCPDAAALERYRSAPTGADCCCGRGLAVSSQAVKLVKTRLLTLFSYRLRRKGISSDAVQLDWRLTSQEWEQEPPHQWTMWIQEQRRRKRTWHVAEKTISRLQQIFSAQMPLWEEMFLDKSPASLWSEPAALVPSSNSPACSER